MLSKLRTAPPADARQRQTSGKSVSCGLAIALGALCASWPGVVAALVGDRETVLLPGPIEQRDQPVVAVPTS